MYSAYNIKGMNMKKLINFTIVACILAGSTCAGATLIQETGTGKLKAQLNNVPLSDIMNFVEEKYGVNFIGDVSALQTPVTVSFDNLDLENMLKRVLARTNFSFVYNKQGEVIEVRLLTGGSGIVKTEKRTSFPIDKPVQGGGEFSAGIFNADGTTAEGIYPNAYAFNASGEVKQPGQEEQDEITRFKVDPNAQDDEITSFKVDPNAADDEITRFKVDPAKPEQDPAFKVVPNVIPPGGIPGSDAATAKP